MNRTLFQDLAEERARDAEALLNAGQWAGVYYMAGYAVECGLKACIARLTNQDDFPDKKFAQDCFTHDIENLVKLARLDDRRRVLAGVNSNFAYHWSIAKDWNELARYQLWSELKARKLFTAITDLNDGVLPWIKGHW